MSIITYKKAGKKDIPALVDLDGQAFNLEYHYHFTTKEFEDIFRKKGETGFIFLKNNPVGYYSWVETTADSAEIMSLAVIPKYQGKGIGKSTLKMMMEKLKNKKNTKIVTHPKNIPALVLYIKQGFIIYGFSKNHYGPGEDRVVLEHNRNPKKKTSH